MHLGAIGLTCLLSCSLGSKDSIFAPITRYVPGDREAALAEIDRLANDEWQMQTYFLNCDPFFDPMRGDPRFEVILRKAGLPD